jgi:hypothetical protein
MTPLWFHKADNMKTFASVMALLLFSPGLFSQVAPSATGGARNFNYVLHYSQRAQFGGYGDWQTATPSGEVDYFNGRSTAPFELRYAGGYTWTLTGPSYTTGWFHRLSVRQGVSGRKWEASVMDDVSYLPQAPVMGFSGIPGTGEPIVIPLPPSSNQSVLTLGTHALYNIASAEVSRVLTSAYAVSAGADYNLIRFPDSNGLDTNTASAHAGLTRRINGRSSATGEYSYTQSGYPGVNFSFSTNSAMGVYERNWTKFLQTSIAIGPEWISSSMPQLIPSSTMVSVNAGLARQMRRDSLHLNYFRGTAGGSGYMLGEKSDSVSAGYSHELESKFNLEATAGYRRSTPLSQRGAYDSAFGGIQLYRPVGRYMSAFASYSIMTQTATMAVPDNVVQHPIHTISFGMTYSPRNSNRH